MIYFPPKHGKTTSHQFVLVLSTILIHLIGLTGCQSTTSTNNTNRLPKVLAVESFLADIARNVSGDRLNIDGLIPNGMDPHAFEPAPQDVVKIAESAILIVNGAGLETWLSRTLTNSGKSMLVIEASSGIPPRIPSFYELVDDPVDPHFWLDPLSVIRYVDNIRAGFCIVDPDGCILYEKNAIRYTAELKDLNEWITRQVEQISPEDRLLITNHESFGYYADRYGFDVVGTIIPSVSTGAMPTAKQLGMLIQEIQNKGAKAIFLEAGINSQLAKTIASETGVVIISNLLTHALTPPDGPAPTYIKMMQYDTQLIVNALK